jgi:hypothetical protein
MPQWVAFVRASKLDACLKVSELRSLPTHLTQWGQGPKSKEYTGASVEGLDNRAPDGSSFRESKLHEIAVFVNENVEGVIEDAQFRRSEVLQKIECGSAIGARCYLLSVQHRAHPATLPILLQGRKISGSVRSADVSRASSRLRF